MKYNTMRLTNTPEETDTNAKQFWNKLFDAYGYDAFHPIEGKEVLKASLDINSSEAEAALQRLFDRGFLAAP